MSNLATAWARRVSGQRLEKLREKKSGDPIFDVNSLRETAQPLAQLARLIMIKYGVSLDSLKDSHRKMAMRTFMPTNTMSHDFNNTKRSSTSVKLTWDALEKFLIVMGLDITDISITTKNRETGEIETWSRSEVYELIKDNPYHPSLQIIRVDKVTE